MIADIRSLLSSLMGLLLCAGMTVVSADTPGSSDFPGIDRFPGSEIVNFQRDDNTVYALALGRMQRAAGTVAPSNAERFSGNLWRITYRIPDGFDAQEVYNHFRSQLLVAGQRELFACQGRGCGSSNFWANDQFNNRVLYGPEANQSYLASTFQVTAQGQERVGYAALYVVTRANRRMYAHLDFLELAGAQADEQRAGVLATAQAMQLRLQNDGVIVIPGLSFNEDDELVDEQGLQLLAEVMQADALLSIYLVGHLADDQPLETLQQRSMNRALAAQQALIRLGVDADRINPQGVGPLAPYCRPGPCGSRIDAVLQ